MPSTTLKRRRTEEAARGKPGKRTKKSKRQSEYHSSDDEDEGAVGEIDFKPVSLQDSAEEDEAPQETKDYVDDRSDDDMESDNKDRDTDPDTADITDASSASDSEASTDAATKKRKRNDPDAFATSMSKILGSKLSTSKRADPVLSRSKDASTASKELTDAKLEARARHMLRAEKRTALDRGRVKDVLGIDSADTSTADLIEEERRLRKTAQRGVIKLFNAVRAAQVKGEEAAREARKTGVVGMGRREEKVNEMSKKGFLDLIAGGGKKAPAAPVET